MNKLCDGCGAEDRLLVGLLWTADYCPECVELGRLSADLIGSAMQEGAGLA